MALTEVTASGVVRIASADELGSITIWLLSEVSVDEDYLDSDMRLKPGGR